ncbi:hypothetical protein EII25_03295 [Erysipelotrichaceae bacterium OH741_COT-311]|nr:hypothetical protein EII25_03295 [Erysipelotrichaceae bacterium OH741_COT-311]
MNINQVIIAIITVLFGFLVSYFKTKSNLKTLVVRWILAAEQYYKDYAKAGTEKFNMVVDKIYNLVPSFLKFIFTKKVIEQLVQNTFNAMQAYAQEQLDKAIDTKIKALDK